MVKSALLTVTALLLVGCSTTIHQGTAPASPTSDLRVFLAPFNNATDDDHAGRALTEITASVLLEHGITLANTELANARTRAENAAGEDGLYSESIKALNATHLLIGTVHEYRYKTDLDGDPVVGISMRLVDTATSRVLWQGSCSRVGVLFSSLSLASQKAVNELVRQMPLPQRSGSKRTLFHRNAP